MFTLRPAAPPCFTSSRRNFLQAVGTGALALGVSPSLAETMINLPLPGGPERRDCATPTSSAPHLGLRFAVGSQDTAVRLSFS
jgi:hypothetical protein